VAGYHALTRAAGVALGS